MKKKKQNVSLYCLVGLGLFFIPALFVSSLIKLTGFSLKYIYIFKTKDISVNNLSNNLKTRTENYNIYKVESPRYAFRKTVSTVSIFFFCKEKVQYFPLRDAVLEI